MNRLIALKDWLCAKGYYQGVFWVILVSLTSSGNDILMRFLGERLDAMQIAFCRFFFAVIILLPIMFYFGRSSFKTARPKLHVLRAVLGFFAVTLWCKGVYLSPLTNVSTIALTVPLFVLPLSYLILKEQVGSHRVWATIFGFLGILIITVPFSSNGYSFSISIGTAFLVASAILFALSDILNKFMVNHESSLAMLFYFALGTSIAGIVPAYLVWQVPTVNEFLLLFFLGFGGNFILYCLLKAFAAVDISALLPYRYLELIFATIAGFVIFSETISLNTLIGAIIVISATFYVAYYDVKKKTR